MLKIKDEVSIEKLKEFGLEKIENYNPGDFKEITLEGEDFVGWVEIKGFKIWKENFYSSCFELETLFDLIQAGLVEKVEG